MADAFDLYRALFDANPRPMWVFDRETRRIAIVNEAAIQLYGWSRDELLAMTLNDLRPPSEQTAFEAAYAAPKGSETYNRVGRHWTKSGALIEVDLEVTKCDLDGRAMSLVCVTVVTGLAQAERRFRLLVEHSADGIAVTNENNVTEYVSPGGERILGYPSKDVLGTTALPRVHPDDLPSWVGPAPGETRQHVARIMHRDGSWRWIESSTTNLVHEPAVRAFVSNYRDITERKIAERAMVETQRRLEYLLSATSAVTYSARVGGDFGATFISANVHELLGYAAREFYDDPLFWLNNIHPEDRPATDVGLQALLRDRSHVLEYRFRHAAGGYRRMRDVARVIDDDHGRPVEIVGYWIDVTDQYRVQESLRRSESNFRALIERSPMAMFVHRDRRIIYVNNAAAALCGYDDASELVGHSALDVIHPDDRESVRIRMQRTAEIGEASATEARMVRRDGSVVVMEAEGMRLDFDGEPANVVIARDVTERREMFARMAIADRLLAVGTLAAGVAHEINNPLTYATTNLEILAMELPALLEAAGRGERRVALQELVADARDGLARMGTIVRELRSLARQGPDTRGPIEVAAVLGSSIKMAHTQIRHRARIVETYDADLPAVRGDASRLGQVFINLLLNAAEAMVDGRLEHNEIRVRATRTGDGNHVQVEIEDTGIGIAPAILRRIFDPFFTTKGTGGGMGLGLAISHELVRDMDGQLCVESEPGRGSTFRVVLPIDRTDAAIASPPAHRGSASARVLLIDDEAAVGRSVCALLGDDYDIVSATRAEEALALLGAGEAFDAIICDLMMPEVSGIELYGRLDADHQRRIIFMTGGAFTQKAREFLARVERPHLEKPFSEEQIRAVIEDLHARSFATLDHR